jgi:hypothetical protein
VNTEPEYDESTDPPHQTIADLDTYEEAGPGAPTAEDLAADRVLYPEATGDDVPDGSQLPDSGDLPEESSDLNDV